MKLKGGGAAAKEKTTGFYFKMSPAERALIERAMAEAGIREMAANGYMPSSGMKRVS